MKLRMAFAIGFLIVFIGMLLFLHMYSMHPSGASVMYVKLWRFYLLETYKVLTDSGRLGPASSNGWHLAAIFGQHLVYSAVGGAVSMGVAAIFRLRRRLNQQQA
jgi:hypothetical protein